MKSYTLARIFVFPLVLSACFAAQGLGSVSELPKNDPSAVARRLVADAGVRGGLVVHLGCGDARLTAALHSGTSFIVHGLDTDADKVALARKELQSAGLYGRVSVDRFDGKHLPYADNLVNLIVAEEPGDVPLEEMTRVLAPNGVAYIKGGNTWTEKRKPWPANIDDWTHFLHGPDNNAVARDQVVGPPSHLQWLADPIHLRSHEHLNSVSALVSSHGRIFYIIDDGPTAAAALPPRWRLMARDAFNGILLWQREIDPWEGHFRLFRSGPPDIARRLVAVGDKVYVTLGYGKAVAELDAATGQIVRTFDATEGALEVVCEKSKLLVVIGAIDLTPQADLAKRFYPPPAPRQKGIVAVDVVSGNLLWRRKDGDTAALMPTTLATADERVFFQNTREVICLDANTGQEKWRTDRPVYTKRLTWSAPTLTVQGGVVLSADGSTGGLREKAPTGGADVDWVLSDTDIREHPVGDLVAFSADDGKRLWTGKSLQGFCNPGNLFVIDGKIWCGADVSTKQALLDVALDLRTGAIVSRRPSAVPVGGHARCYRSKATERFLITSNTGVEFVNVQDWSWNANQWLRGTCQYGIMPANGLLYVPPDSCACRPEMRLHGFSAMAPERKAEGSGFGVQHEGSGFGVQGPGKAENAQLERGPAYTQIQNPKSKIQNSADWPTYRHDAARSGRTAASVPASLEPLWETKIEGKLTSLTVAEGKVLVSRVDSHTVYAMDAQTGRTAWSFTAGGQVDSPPTIIEGLAIFGCRDGRVYCLKADDGQLVWRLRAAPEDRYLVAMESLESAWPVNGSVLVHGGKVWFAAGRSPYLDGGIRLYAVEPASGRVVTKQTIFSRGPQELHTSRQSDRGNFSPPGLPDILSASNDTVYMRWMGFDENGKMVDVKPHLFSATGFLDDTWWHRTYWQYGAWMQGGFGGWPKAAQQTPAGRIMVVDDGRLFGYGRSKYESGNGGAVHAGHVGVVKEDYQDMGLVDPAQNPYRLYSANMPASASVGRPGKRQGIGSDPIRWQTSVPMLVRAMLLADRTLFIAGPSAGSNNSGLENLRTNQPGTLWAVGADDGKVRSQHELTAAPVFDGMAAAGGRLYLATLGGTVVCLGERQ